MTVSTGIFGLSIAMCSFICLVLISITFGVTWYIESPVLLEVIGFRLPVPIKVMSLISTLLLFLVLIDSPGIIYFVIISSLLYFITHSMLLGGIIQFYIRSKEYERPLARLLGFDKLNWSFVFFVFVCFIRIILCFPYVYYALVLFVIRKHEGSGWKRVSAIEHEVATLPKRIEQLKRRQEFILNKYCDKIAGTLGPVE